MTLGKQKKLSHKNQSPVKENRRTLYSYKGGSVFLRFGILDRRGQRKAGDFSPAIL
jgi:hypothetical protein